MLRRWLMMAALLCCLLPVCGMAEEAMPVLCEGPTGEVLAEHVSESLWWRMDRVQVDRATCLLTRVWMADPGRQIGKAASDWQQNIMTTAELAQREPDASLIINASGYVTRIYPWIPENYPGKSQDYYFTPLGSVTVTDGETFRCLEDVPYYGLTVNEDGLRMHVGEDPQAVLASAPSQTFSFYVECPVIQDHQSVLDHTWRFANTRAMRTIIAKLDANNYLIMTVTSKGGGMTMADCVAYLLAQFDPEWAYNLDGGPSSALMYRESTGALVTVWRPGQQNVDIMTFSELPKNE